MDSLGPLQDRFTALVAEHQAWLRGYVRTLGIAVASVDDVAQETFLVAYRRFDEYDPERPFAAWLKGIAKHLAANERRRHFKRGRLVEPSLAAALAAVDETDAAEDWPMTTEHLRACLELLPAHARELLYLRYQEDLDATALGTRLGRDGNAVRQALFRVRESVRRCIENRAGVTPT
ncbi:MAG: sigma-70 family RNA polymerase sigma factor [Planctomycetota bacterium]